MGFAYYIDMMLCFLPSNQLFLQLQAIKVSTHSFPGTFKQMHNLKHSKKSRG
jgi:hypothetical protein